MRQPVEEWLGATLVSAGEGEACMTMVVGDAHLNGAGVLHGGVAFALADATLAHAAIIPQSGATLTAQITFIASCTLGAELVAVARIASRWGLNSLVDVTIRHGDTTIAEFRGQVRSPVR